MDKKGRGGGRGVGGGGESGRRGGGAEVWRRKWQSSESSFCFLGFCFGGVAYQRWHHFLLPSSGQPVILSSSWLTQWKRRVCHEHRHKGAHCGVISNFLQLTFQKIGDVFQRLPVLARLCFTHQPGTRSRRWPSLLSRHEMFQSEVFFFLSSGRGGATAMLLVLYNNS